MDIRLGYVASCLTRGIGASHTTRVANATRRRLDELIALNLAELEQILLFNEAHGIHVFRIGSSLVPLASHPVNRNRWWKTFERDLARIGKIALRSNQRLSLHPSPAGASLASMHQRVRNAAVAELEYATRVLDLLGQDANARVVVHVGGAAPERPTAIESAHIFLDEMPNDARRRLVIEHDDRVWTALETLPLAREHGLPMLADTLHNAVLPSDPVIDTRELLRLADATWHALGLRPKIHIASQRANAPRGAHTDRIALADYRAFLQAVQSPTDVMIEAKDKDLALFELRKLGAETRAAPLRSSSQRPRTYEPPQIGATH